MKQAAATGVREECLDTNVWQNHPSQRLLNFSFSMIIMQTFIICQLIPYWRLQNTHIGNRHVRRTAIIFRLNNTIALNLQFQNVVDLLKCETQEIER